MYQGKSGAPSRSPAKSASPDKGKKDAKKGGKKSPAKGKDTSSNIDPDSEIPRGRCPLKKRGEEKEEPAKIGWFNCTFIKSCLSLNSLCLLL